MSQIIIKIKDLYFIWSTVVDAPVSSGMTKIQLRSWVKVVEGLAGLERLPKRLERVEATGTSSYVHGSLDEVLAGNRAGLNEKSIPADLIYSRYFKLP